MMVPSIALLPFRVGRAALLVLAAVLLSGVLRTPAAALINGCCICDACAFPPVTQCFEAPAQGCQAQCNTLTCGSFMQTALSCGSQPQCPTFTAPASAPALEPAGLGIAALVLAGFGRRAMRRQRRRPAA
jgi:hypothetical protein